MKARTVLFVIVLNTVIVALEIFFGFLSESMALVADALHNLGDVFAVIVTYIALVLGAKAASKTKTFGYQRAEMMAAFVNALFLVITMVYILYEATVRFVNPQSVDGWYMVGVASVALVANGISAWLLGKAGAPHHHHGEECDHHHHEEDLNLKSAYLHMLSDALISLGVVVGGVFVLVFEIDRIDSVIAIFFSIWILKESWWVLKKSFFSLMDFTDIDIDKSVDLILSFAPVASLHDLHITKPNSKERHISAHIVLKENLDLMAIEALLEEIRHALSHHGFTHIVLQPESTKYTQDEILCANHL